MARNANDLTPAPAAEAPETVPRLRPKVDEVLIRMYGQGVGDCFLLAFPRRATTGAGRQRPVYVVIDCGVLSGTPGSSERMKTIVADIRRTTQDDFLPKAADGEHPGHIDLLVVTHEHWDHLSGFIYKAAQDEWKRIQVDTVWMGWTAKRGGDDDLASVLQTIKDLQRQALAAVAEQAERFGASEWLQTALGLNLFLADSEEAPDGSLAAGLEFVKKRADDNCIYCEPGEVRPVPGTDSVAYILGPPRKWKFLSKMNPSARTPETYENPFALRIDDSSEDDRPEPETARALRRLVENPSTFTAFITALQNRPMAGEDTSSRKSRMDVSGDLFYRTFPFDRSFRVPLAVAESRAGNAPTNYPALDSYLDCTNQWRRIDNDWLMAADAFALAADNFVNNTSLVLAFELPPAAGSRKRNILLFVADAQVGNWLSWDEIPSWTIRDDARPAQRGFKPDIGDLLQRTVFYKVGHHGSHNATLKTKGVERMRTEGPLTAFVPVSPAVADNVGWDEMPLEAMLKALAERPGGRVVLPDGVWLPTEDDDGRQMTGERQRAAEHQKLEARRKAGERIGLEVSTQMLPDKRRRDDDKQIEPEVPLWTQIAIRY